MFFAIIPLVAWNRDQFHLYLAAVLFNQTKGMREEKNKKGLSFPSPSPLSRDEHNIGIQRAKNPPDA